MVKLGHICASHTSVLVSLIITTEMPNKIQTYIHPTVVGCLGQNTASKKDK